jgi:hypothetical protein
MIASVTEPSLMQQGAFQFILFGLMLIGIFILLKITIAK